MPTGYTNDVGTGKMTDFSEFALRCARNFGATVSMRDDPLSKPIPEAFQPSQYNRERLAEAEAELRRIEMMNAAELELQAAKEHKSETDNNTRHIQEYKDTRKRYEVMLGMAKKWCPPTEDHQGLKDFMIEQLEQSIEWDCLENIVQMPRRMSGEEWKRQHTERLTSEMEYHAKAYHEEVKRTEERNRWIRQLRESL